MFIKCISSTVLNLKYVKQIELRGFRGMGGSKSRWRVVAVDDDGDTYDLYVSESREKCENYIDMFLLDYGVRVTGV